jgi:hypothetical protein
MGKEGEMDTAHSKRGQVNKTKTGRWGKRLIILARILLAINIVMALIGASVGNAVLVAHNDEPMNVIPWIALVIPAGIVGLLIVSQYPRHTVGWLLLLLSFSFALYPFCTLFAVIWGYVPAYASNPVVVFFVWMLRWMWLAAPIIPVIILPLYFPDGRLLSRRWRFAAVAVILGLFIGMLSYAIDPDPLDMGSNNWLPNPYHFGVDAAVSDFLFQSVAVPLLTVGLLGALGSVILRYRRAESVQRAQMKWVLYVIVLSTGLQEIARRTGLADQLIWFETIALPLTIGIAILRYRLYDIDLIIRRTLIYSILTGILALLYFGGVVLLQRIFQAAVGQTPDVAIVISTLLIAALFSPIRRRVQDTIDRRFYRRRYDVEQTLATFNQTLRDEVDIETLKASLVNVVQETMQPTHIALWLASTDKGRENP